jgi:hypothetical protein
MSPGISGKRELNIGGASYKTNGKTRPIIFQSMMDRFVKDF